MATNKTLAGAQSFKKKHSIWGLLRCAAQSFQSFASALRGVAKTTLHFQ